MSRDFCLYINNILPEPRFCKLESVSLSLVITINWSCSAISGIDWNISYNMDHLCSQLDLILILLWVASTLEEQTYDILRNSYKVVRNIPLLYLT